MTKQLIAIDTANDTFQVWVDRFNEVITVVNTEVVTVNTTAGISTGNGYVNGFFGANTLFATDLRGGNLSTSGILTITSNTTIIDSSFLSIGNSTVNSTINSTSFNIGSNVNLTSNTINVGNSTVNVSINSTSITVTSDPLVQQSDIGTDPDQIPLNQYLGSLAYQSDSIAVSNLFTIGVDTYFVANGNVGIGNSNPTYKLRVDGNISLSSGIHVNGSFGTVGQVLHSNGTTVYWDTDDQGVTSVSTGNGLTGGPITTTGTVSVLANNGITANATGLYVTQGTGTVVNTSGVHVNSAYIGTLTANNSTNLNGQPASFYTNATNLATGTVPTARLGSGTANSITFLSGDQSYKVALTAAVTSVSTGNGLSGGPITSTGTVSVLANNGIVANSTGLYVGQGTGIVVNTSGVHVNSAYISSFVVDVNANTSQYSNGSFTNTFTVGTASYFVANGNLGIGNTTPAHKLRVQGDISVSGGVHANGSLGSSGQVLFSNGTGVFWAETAGGSVSSVNSGNGLTGGPITTIGTLSVLANNGITSNSTGLYVTQGTGTVVNTTGVHVNATYIGTLSSNNTSFLGGTAAASYQLNSTLAANVATLTANNSTNLNGQPASFYTNATNLSTGTVPTARLGTGTANSITFLAGDQSYKTSVTSVATSSGLTGGTITTTGTVSVLANNGITANSTGLYVTQGTGTVVNSTGVHVNSTYIGSLSSNNASFLGTVAAASYQLNSTLAANVATLSSNSSTYSNSSITNTFTVGTSAFFISNGNVGIGNSTPASKLVVSGNATVTSSFSANNLTATSNGLTVGTAAYFVSNGNVGIGTAAPSSKLKVEGIIADTTGDLRTVPISAKTVSYQLATADAGLCISTNAAITVNGAVLSSGFVTSIFNNSAASITITSGSGITMYLAGSSTTGNRTLAQRGLATILCTGSNSFVISGSGLT